MSEIRHIIAVSGGKDSTALALWLQENRPKNYEYIITPTGNELPEMVAHWGNLEVILKMKFTRLKPFTNEDGLLFLINEYNALPNWRQRWCTRQLKIEPTLEFLKKAAPCIHYVGLRADESDRGGIYGDVPGVKHEYTFQEIEWDIKDVWSYLAERGIKIPRRTDCAWCYGQRLIEWKRLYQQHPELYQKAVDLEKASGHTFRSPGRDSWPAPLDKLAEEFESGRRVRGENKSNQLSLFAFDEDTEPCRVCSL